MSTPALKAQVDALCDGALLRLKGVVALEDGQHHAVQWASGDTDIALTPYAGSLPPLGLTCIKGNR